MAPLILKQLDGRTLTLRIQAAGPVRSQRGAEFTIPVVVVNASDRPVHWSPDNPLHLSYRWLSVGGKVLNRDGLRTKIPGPLFPDKVTNVDLAVVSPEDTAEYILLVSLVLEGIHWGCDVAACSAIPIKVAVIPPPAWPTALHRSTGGKALRGAIAASKLHAEFFGRAEQAALPTSRQTADSTGEGPAATAAIASGRDSLVQRRPRKLRARFRNWFRRSLGITDLEEKIEQAAQEAGGEVRGLMARVGQTMSAVEGNRTLIEELALAGQLVADDVRETHLTIRSQSIAIDQLQDAVRVLAEIIPELTRKQNSLSDEVAGVGTQLNQRLAKLDPLASSALQELRVLSQRLDVVTNHSTERVIREVSALKGPFSEVQLQFEDRMEALAKKGQDLLHELKHGDVSVELISTLRQLTEIVAASQVPGAIEEYSRDFAEWKQVAEKNWLYQFSKLDSLLMRQSIPLARSGVVLLRNRFGLLAVQDDDPLAVGYYSSGDLPERATVTLVENLLQTGDTFVDVGANVGIYSLIAGRKMGPDGRVHAFEPTPSTCDALRVTIAVNGLARQVDVHECALGAENGTADLFVARTSGHNSLMRFDDTFVRANSVDVRRGDQILGELKPALIKVDVEGWEPDVLDGFSNLLSNSRHTNAIVEYSSEHIRRRGLKQRDWLKKVAGIRKGLWRLDDDRVALIPVKRIEDLPSVGSNLFLADELPRNVEFMLK